MAQKDGKKIDHLPEDEPIPGQLFVCLSFISPEGIRNCTTRGLKVRGVYPSYEAAKARCDELQQTDKDFDIFIGEVGKWLPWDPDINDENKVKDAHYQEEELQKLMVAYKNNQERGRELEKKRKDEMIQKAARDEKSKLAKQKERMRKKLGKMQADKQLNDITTKQLEGVLPDEPSNKVGGKKPKEVAVPAAVSATEEQLKQKDELAKSEKDRLNENQKMIEEQQNTVASIDEQLAKIQSLYNKLNKKTAEANSSN
jgi:hypothetical protein